MDPPPSVTPAQPRHVRTTSVDETLSTLYSHSPSADAASLPPTFTVPSSEMTHSSASSPTSSIDESFDDLSRISAQGGAVAQPATPAATAPWLARGAPSQSADTERTERAAVLAAGRIRRLEAQLASVASSAALERAAAADRIAELEYDVAAANAALATAQVRASSSTSGGTTAPVAGAPLAVAPGATAESSEAALESERYAALITKYNRLARRAQAMQRKLTEWEEWKVQAESVTRDLAMRLKEEKRIRKLLDSLLASENPRSHGQLHNALAAVEAGEASHDGASSSHASDYQRHEALAQSEGTRSAAHPSTQPPQRPGSAPPDWSGFTIAVQQV